MSLTSDRKPVESCTLQEMQAMFELMTAGFLHTKIEDFAADLAQKEQVMFLRYCEEIVGFGTLTHYPLQVAERDVIVIFSGDTFVLPQYRCSNGLGVQIAQYFCEVETQFPDKEVYYVLLSKGPRTYKILPLFFRNYFPQADHENQRLKEVMTAFGNHYSSGTFDVQHGLILHRPGSQTLLPDGPDIHINPQDSHDSFFQKMNPDFAQGNELICIGQIQQQNFAPMLKRFAKTRS